MNEPSVKDPTTKRSESLFEGDDHQLLEMYELHDRAARIFFSLALQPQFGPWSTSMRLSDSLQFSTS
jgi:hypothetical protein